MWAQIDIDILRTHPDLPLFQNKEVQRRLLRLLFVWAIRHPASGYVQGMNDLATPFFAVFLAEHAGVPVEDILQHSDVAASFDAAALDAVEADAFWCVSKLLDGIQDHYTFSQ